MQLQAAWTNSCCIFGSMEMVAVNSAGLAVASLASRAVVGLASTRL